MSRQLAFNIILRRRVHLRLRLVREGKCLYRCVRGLKREAVCDTHLWE
jgi:hypothetical protein